jgi:hypothetical protein
MEGRIKQLEAEVKRLKKNEVLDKEEIEYDAEGNDIEIDVIPCVFCKQGYMHEVFLVGRNFRKCSSCERMKKA